MTSFTFLDLMELLGTLTVIGILGFALLALVDVVEEHWNRTEAKRRR